MPVTLQSQNYINVTNPIKMMANFQMNFSTSVHAKNFNSLKENENNVINRAECNIPPNNNLIWYY